MDLAPARGSFSPEELARADRMASPGLRRRFLARRWMARALLARETGGDPGGLVLERRCERCGELHPASPLRAGARSVWWSASSSAGLAAVAISDCRVGLDLERRQERPRWEQIADRFYSEDERRAVAGSPARFLEFWTLKEAYLKALGLGLPGGLRSLECTGLSPSAGEWSTSAAHPGWRFRQLDPRPGFAAALAVEGAPAGVQLHRWAPAPADPACRNLVDGRPNQGLAPYFKEMRMSVTTKDDLAKQVAARTGLETGQAKRAVEATIEEITAQLAAGNEVKFTGFGKFSTVDRPAREGRNPQTGESMQIAAKTAAKFSPGAELKKAVNG